MKNRVPEGNGKKKNQLAQQKRVSVSKLRFLRVLFTLSILFLMSSILYLKMVKGNAYEILALEQQVKSGSTDRVIMPNRGSIIDRNRQSLATSTTVYNVSLDVNKLVQRPEKEQEETVQALKTILGIPEETTRAYLSKDPENPYLKRNYTIIQNQISRNLADQLKQAKPSCVYLYEDSQRNYTYDYFAAQLIGFLRGENRWGLERFYDSYLVGVEGRSFRSVGDSAEAETSILPPEQGKTLITTIDLGIQKFAEEAVLKTGKEYEPMNASVIVMDPNTGEILGWAQYPSFDLNDPANIEKINDVLLKEQWDTLSKEEQMNYLNELWKDYNVASTFEPGSIYKPMVIAAALEEGVISLDDTFYCSGSKHVGSETIPCWNTAGHGKQTLTEVAANSCNVGMMDIIEKLGPERYYKYQHDFGYGQLTEIDLPLEESAASLVNTLDQLRNSVYLATNSMGQGFNATAIQSLTAFAATINGGNLMKPYVVSAIIDKDGRTVLENKPTVTNKVISKEVSDEMREMLHAVVSPTGTGKHAIIEGYNIGGKTGTAQQGKRSDKKYTVSFVGFLPVENPQYIAIAVINQAKGDLEGSTSAAPLLREVLANVIAYKGILPSSSVDADGNSIKITSFLQMPDLVGKSIEEASTIVNQMGVDYDFVGSSGTNVKNQIPAADTQITKDTKIHIYIGDGESTAEKVQVPSVVGLSVSEAENVLKVAGFQVKVQDANVMDGYGVFSDASVRSYNAIDDQVPAQEKKTAGQEKVVVVQMPSADIEIPKNTMIKLKVR